MSFRAKPRNLFSQSPRNAKNTAATRHPNATRWFQWKDSPLNINITMTVNTDSEITSWITLSCTSENGPPFILDPILFAGTARQYSKNAIPHDNRITRINGHPVEIFISCSFRCPYHAKVISTFDATSINTVQIPCVILFFLSYRAKREYLLPPSVISSDSFCHFERSREISQKSAAPK